MENAEIIYNDFFEEIMRYINSYEPSVEDTMHFIGAILYSITDMINMTRYEKTFYLEIYRKLIIKHLNEKETNEDKIHLVIK